MESSSPKNSTTSLLATLPFNFGWLKDNLYRLMFDESDGSAMNRLLIATMILLSIVSATTSFGGLQHYLSSGMLALFATVGLHLLMLVSALLIASKNAKIAGICVSFLTTSVSIFFSFSTFLGNANPAADRVRNSQRELARAANREIHGVLTHETLEATEKFESDIAEWRDLAIDLATSSLVKDMDKYDQLATDEGVLKDELELAVGRDPKGWRVRSLTKKLRGVALPKDRLGTSLGAYSKDVKLYKAVVGSVLLNIGQISVLDIDNLLDACAKVVNYAGKGRLGHCAMIREITEGRWKVKQAVAYWGDDELDCNFIREATWHQVEACVERAPVAQVKKTEIIGRIENSTHEYSEDRTIFEFSLDSIAALDVLAVLSFMLATLFDTLILIAGFLRTYPEYGISKDDQRLIINVIGCGSGMGVKRLKMLMENAKVSPAEEDSTYVSWVPIEYFDGFASLVGILESGGWAIRSKKNNRDGLALDGRFVGWATNKISARHDANAMSAVTSNVSVASTGTFDAVD